MKKLALIALVVANLTFANDADFKKGFETAVEAVKLELINGSNLNRTLNYTGDSCSISIPLILARMRYCYRSLSHFQMASPILALAVRDYTLVAIFAMPIEIWQSGSLKIYWATKLKKKVTAAELES